MVYRWRGKGANPNSHNIKPPPLKGEEPRSVEARARITPTAKAALKNVNGMSVADIYEWVGQALAKGYIIVALDSDENTVDQLF